MTKKIKISLLADHPLESKKIAQWYFDEWLHEIPELTVNRISEKMSKSINRNSLPIMLLAHLNSSLIGVVELKISENSSHPEYTPWLGGLYIKPNFRGNGYSNTLIGEAKQTAINLGNDHLFLQCEKKNIGLYKKHGFKVLHDSSHGKFSVTIMKWEKIA